MRDVYTPSSLGSFRLVNFSHSLPGALSLLHHRRGSDESISQPDLISIPIRTKLIRCVACSQNGKSGLLMFSSSFGYRAGSAPYVEASKQTTAVGNHSEMTLCGHATAT